MLTLERQLTQSRQWKRKTLFTHFQGIAIRGGYIVYNYFFPPKKRERKKVRERLNFPFTTNVKSPQFMSSFFDFFSEWPRGTTPAAAKSTSDPGARSYERIELRIRLVFLESASFSTLCLYFWSLKLAFSTEKS